MKPFDIELAKQGKPVCTRDGRNARIICFDRKNCKRIVALVQTNSEIESLLECYDDGRVFHSDSNNDLMMLSEKKEGWINIYKGATYPFSGSYLYDTEEEAKGAVKGDKNYVTTTKVCWEE